MITDTAMFRYKYYHTASDNYDMIDYDRMARVVEGLKHVVRNLASEYIAERTDIHRKTLANDKQS